MCTKCIPKMDELAENALDQAELYMAKVRLVKDHTSDEALMLAFQGSTMAMMGHMMYAMRNIMLTIVNRLGDVPDHRPELN